jgi:hypothetical protein
MRYSCGCELRLDALQAKVESMNNVSEHSSTYDDEIARRLKDIKKNAPPAPKKANKPGSTGKNSVVIKL